MRILLIEDDVELCRSLSLLLEQQHFSVTSCHDGEEGLFYILENGHDLVLLDRMLPGLDGLEVLRQARAAHCTTPILFLTALGSLEDRVTGLDLGADDYLVKPFSFQELEARIKALLRRNKEAVTNQLTCDNLVLDCNTRRAKRGDADIDLTVKEYRLLEYFMTHQGVALSRITLLKDVWDKNFDTNTNIVDVYVNYLRVKIDRDFDKKLIHTVVGLGYIMNA